MLLRQLEYFVAVARERHFARAAEACYVSQPALSASIAKLERELNVTLINRGRNFEGLTVEGDRLVVWAKRVLAVHDGLVAEAAALRSGNFWSVAAGGGADGIDDDGAADRGILRVTSAGAGEGLLPSADNGIGAPGALFRA